MPNLYWSKLTQYFQERFPPHQMVTLALVLGITTSAFTSAALARQFNFYAALVTSLALILFLLKLRLFDEFKDAAHDSANYPNRPVPRGLISLSQLKPLLVLVLLLEIATAFIFSHNFYWFLPIFIYSLLMAKEFFIADWLKQHFSAYIISHQIAVFPLVIYLSTLNRPFIFPPSVEFALFSLYFFASMFILEVARKYRDPESEVKQIDTYTGHYGCTGASLLLLLLALLILICHYLLSPTPTFSLILLFVLISLSILMIRFIKHPNRQRAKTVFVLTAIYVILANLFSIYHWIL